MPFCVRKSPWQTGSLPSNRRRLPEHTRPSNGQWKPCVGRMARGRMFVDVVSLSSAFSVCLGTYSWSLGKGSIDENPRHRGFGFVRVQFAGAGWMYLPMRQWAGATALQQRPRYRAALHGDMRAGRAFNRPNQSANDPATGHNILPTGPGLLPFRELQVTAGLQLGGESASASDGGGDRAAEYTARCRP